MKKVFILLVSLFAMMSASLSTKAQEVTITLNPGWNWISYTNAEPMDIAMAMGDFVPMEGDVLKSPYGFAEYSNGSWIGGLQQFTPGLGYMYFSNRTSMVSFVYVRSSSLFAVTTAEPTDVTTISAVVGGTVNVPEGVHVFLRGVCWGTEPNPDIDGDHTTEEIGVGEFTRSLYDLVPGITFYVRAYALTDFGLAYGEEFSFTTIENSDHDYVDLGLPSGRLWATCNVGAETPEEYGYYFAWGETQPKEYYDWNTYQYCNGYYNTLTKYCNNPYYGYNGFTDNLTTLLPEDDAATTNWGLDWRMPTGEEWQELIENTTSTWTTQNGIGGRLFTSSNGNSMFLPAAGNYWEYPGDMCDYWSSTLDPDNPSNAWNYSFDMAYISEDGNRFAGLSVRPVRTENNAPVGALNGKFTINEDGDQVYFSQGNLQYIGSATTPYWKFADSQLDYLGDNGQGSTDQDVDRDLFGWGTSGYNHGAVCYQPWSTNNNHQSDYYAYGCNSCNLYDQSGMADWGYNAISNGGNTINQWRTMTWREWYYLFNRRNTTSGIRYAKAQVNNVNGIIILPDNWSVYYFSLNSPNDYNASFDSNIITASQWSTLEHVGVVFLPASGSRNGTSINSLGSRGYYSTSSYNSSGGVFIMTLCEYPLGIVGGNFARSTGVSVRLVCDVEESVGEFGER